MEQFRQRLLESTVKQSDLIEIFSQIDQDHSGRINYKEFHRTIKYLKLEIKNDEEIKSLFQQFDTTHNGEIDLNEFLKQLRPPMSQRRERAALNLFNGMDVNHDGKLTAQDLKTKYASQIKNKKKKGDPSVDKAIHNFLNKFDTRGQEDGVIDKDEFLGFCSMLSATVNDDIYFEHVLRLLFDFRL
ncbi:unnamed protein product [Rotaria magnacalcarata]|uniref:EF-hand domain-containing protein n=1 Tax=Rotaria magnacalcarata TaxID=392030 RepID=A0A819ILQ9_9BILA|nr:unnamed protein product [Rotaria magnacalcarata]CAF2237249.1 unnamed protein product [Rotaria magnacalcarata]CAF3919205.1 unnamed protein product [Rotaria magnacalcarata]CAF4204591.1 unnamed protein product [Rotaria magnacalcarata]